MNVGTEKDSKESLFFKVKIKTHKVIIFYLAPFFRKTALIVSKTHLMSNIKLQ